MENFHELATLSPAITGWHIHVNVLRSFRIIVNPQKKTLYLVLANNKGQRIEAVIQDPYVDHYYDFIDEGMWISIMHFAVRNNIDPIRSCKHNFKIFFLDYTVVKPAQSINNVPLNQFVPFSAILGDLVDTDILIDLVGEIFDVGHLENNSTNINEVGGWRLTFKLRNRENRVLNGMTQGNEALQFNQNYQPFRGSKLVVALRFWKIDRFSNGKKNVQIRTHGVVSKIYPNPNIPEAQELNPIVIE